MATENELVYEWFPQLSPRRTAKMNEDTEVEGDDKQIWKEYSVREINKFHIPNK